MLISNEMYKIQKSFYMHLHTIFTYQHINIVARFIYFVKSMSLCESGFIHFLRVIKNSKTYKINRRILFQLKYNFNYEFYLYLINI